MAGISSIGGALGPIEFEARLQATQLRLQRDAVDLQGDLALQLIAAAAIDPSIGGALDVRA